MASKKLRIVPLGGLGEIGKNMMSIEYGENILIIDTGIMFPENDMLGIDYIIPDFRYLMDKIDKVRGIVVTHGHEDHTGAIRHVIQEMSVPIYATPLTRGLLEVKLRRGRLLKEATIKTVNAGESVQIGPFGVEFFHVSHSIPDGVGLGSVLALLSDSTNADRPGWTPSEAVIDGGFDAAFSKAPGRLIIGSFASLISRMAQVAQAAQRHGRKMALVGNWNKSPFRIAPSGYDSHVLPSDTRKRGNGPSNH